MSPLSCIALARRMRPGLRGGWWWLRGCENFAKRAEWGLAQAMGYIDLLEAACAELAEAPQQAQG